MSVELKRIVPVALSNVPPEVVNEPPIDMVPLAKVSVPEFNTSESSNAKLVSSKLNVPDPLNVAPYKSEPETRTVAVDEVLIINSEVL